MRITSAGRHSRAQLCAICERTSAHRRARGALLAPTARTGSTSARSARTIALEHGWVKEGSPTHAASSPSRAAQAARGSSPRCWRAAQRPRAEPVVDEPILRRLSEPELAMVEAAELFNESAFRRTVARDRQEPRRAAGVASCRSPGSNSEVVDHASPGTSPGTSTASRPDSAQPVRLAERGHEPARAGGACSRAGTRKLDAGRPHRRRTSRPPV